MTTRTPRPWGLPSSLSLVLACAATVLPASGHAQGSSPQEPKPLPADLAAELERAAAADRAQRTSAAGADTTGAPRAEATPRSSGIGFHDNSSNPALSLILDTAAFWYSSEPGERYSEGGHISNHTGPYLQGVELAASSSIDPFFAFEMEFNLVHLHFEQVFARTTALPLNLQLRAGHFRTRLGRRNTQCLHQWRFVGPPLPLGYLFGAEGMTLPGAELSVLLPLPWFAELVLAAQGGEDTKSGLGTSLDGVEDLLWSPRLEQFVDLHDDLALMLGANASLARSPLATGPRQEITDRAWVWGGDLTLKYRPIGQGRTGSFFVSLTTEAWLRELEAPGDLWRDWGGYSELAVGLSKEWQVAARLSLWRILSGPSPQDNPARAALGSDSTRGEVALSYAPSHFSRVRLQYGLDDIEPYALGHRVVVQLEVSAGAHGAHAY